MRMHTVLMDEVEDELGLGGMPGEGVPEGVPLGEGEGGEETPPGFLKDWSEDDVYQRLQDAGEMPDRLNALESRLFGSQGPIKERMDELSKALGNRVSVNTEALKKLEDYDPKLKEALEEILPDLLNVTPIDETVLEPYLSPVQAQMQEQFGAELVKSFYSVEDINSIVPPADENGNFTPNGQRHQDFVNWYSKQGYEMRQALTKLGSPYVQALRKFEKWEGDQIKEREKKASDVANKMNGGRQPQSRGKRSSVPRLETQSDGFYSVFKEKGN